MRTKNVFRTRFYIHHAGERYKKNFMTFEVNYLFLENFMRELLNRKIARKKRFCSSIQKFRDRSENNLDYQNNYNYNY